MTDTPLARWRARLGLSQRAAARALGMALTTYQSHERGSDVSTGAPRPDRLVIRLAAAALEAGIEPIEELVT